MFTFSYVVLPWSNLDKNKERNHLFVLHPFWSFTMDQPSCACKCKVQLWPTPPGQLRKALLAWSWGDATRIHRLFRCVSMPSLLQRVPALIRMRGMCVPLVYSFHSWANISLIKRQTSVSRSEVHSGRWVFWGGQADASRWPLHCERWMPVSSVRLQGNIACSGNYCSPLPEGGWASLNVRIGSHLSWIFRVLSVWKMQLV